MLTAVCQNINKDMSDVHACLVTWHGDTVREVNIPKLIRVCVLMYKILSLLCLHTAILKSRQ